MLKKEVNTLYIVVDFRLNIEAGHFGKSLVFPSKVFLQTEISIISMWGQKKKYIVGLRVHAKKKNKGK